VTVQRSRILALLLVLAALAAMVAACGGEGNHAAGAVATTAPATTTAAADRKWKKVVPGGDCECADGSEFAFWERRADPSLPKAPPTPGRLTVLKEMRHRSELQSACSSHQEAMER
jgi:hypothetical protein